MQVVVIGAVGIVLLSLLEFGFEIKDEGGLACSNESFLESKSLIGFFVIIGKESIPSDLEVISVMELCGFESIPDFTLCFCEVPVFLGLKFLFGVSFSHCLEMPLDLISLGFMLLNSISMGIKEES